MTPRRDVVAGSGWRNADFRKLWAAASVSLVGSQVTALALPLLAAITLGASAVQMGLLAATSKLPFLLFSLPAGIWVDRVRRRPVLIACDLGSALLLLSLPLAAVLGWLGLTQLFLVAFGLGALEVVGEIAHYAYVPALVGRDGLVEGNSRLHVSHSVAASAGPGLGGLLIQAVTAPIAVLVDAGSFLLSALLLRAIDRLEAAPARPARAEPPFQAIGAGLRSLVNHPLLRPIVVTSIAAGFCLGALDALVILYATRELGLGPATIGLLFAAGGACSVIGAVVAGSVATRWGIGPAILGGWTVEASVKLLIPLAAGPTWLVLSLLAASFSIGGLGAAVANVHQWSLRQAVTPDALQGRVTASHRFLVYGASALGALAGGVLGAVIGLRPALLVWAAGDLFARSWAFLSPLRVLQTQPAPGDDLVAAR